MKLDILKQHDEEFRNNHVDAQPLDPLSFAEDFSQALLDSNRAADEKACASIGNAVLDRALDWAERHQPSERDPQTLAVIRDTDRVIGSMIAIGGENAGDAALRSRWSDTMLDAGLPTSRATIYNYAWTGYRPEDDAYRTFTGDPREKRLIQSFDSSLQLAHTAMWSLIRTKQAYESPRQTEEDLMLDELELASVSIKQILATMPQVYREADPAFIAKHLFPYFRGYKHGDRFLEGPSPSPSAYYVLDQVILGGFEDLRSDHALEKQLSYRLQVMPTHLREIVQELESSSLGTPLKKLVSSSLEATAFVERIGKYWWQFKHVHKSFADKGLKARGKTLNKDEPDLLSGLVRAAQKNMQS